MATTMTREEILNAMEHFDRAYSNPNDYDSWLDKATYKKAVRHNDRLYPCKWLVADVLQVETSSINTNTDAIPILTSLGFEVIPKPNHSGKPAIPVAAAPNPSLGQKKETPTEPPVWLRTVKLVLEITAIAITVIGGIIALIWRSK